MMHSALFNAAFFGWSLLSSVIFAPLFIISTPLALKAGRPWAEGSLWLAKKICHLEYEVRGREFMTQAPVIYASKHQSAWDTLIFFALFENPTYVLKRELLRIPFWGWYLWRMKMIAIDRKAGASSIKHMVRAAKDTLNSGRAIVIYPEGTRTVPGAEPNYHPGVTALYSQLHVPVIPVALNSGYYWGRNAFAKRPGKVIIEFLPPLPPGMNKKEFASQLQASIETASTRLLEEAKNRSSHASV